MECFSELQIAGMDFEQGSESDLHSANEEHVLEY